VKEPRTKVLGFFVLAPQRTQRNAEERKILPLIDADDPGSGKIGVTKTFETRRKGGSRGNREIGEYGKTKALRGAETRRKTGKKKNLTADQR
jgi:hypothetical protein